MGYKVDLIVTSDEGPFASDVDSTVNIVNFDCVRVLSALILLVAIFGKAHRARYSRS